jgi:hypothetical protein
MFISVTRLRLRHWWTLPEFFWRSRRSIVQAARSDGFLAGYTLMDRRWTFWTMTGWQSETAMKAYRGSGPHKVAMQKLFKWCDEASVAHWQADQLPSWAEAWEGLKLRGRFTPVKHPSEAHRQKHVAAPRTKPLRQGPIR